MRKRGSLRCPFHTLLLVLFFFVFKVFHFYFIFNLLLMPLAFKIFLYDFFTFFGAVTVIFFAVPENALEPIVFLLSFDVVNYPDL